MSTEGDELACLILAVVQLVPKGKVASYGQIAKLAGLPKHARLVGRVLSRLDAKSELPWYRVLNSQGVIRVEKCNTQGENIQCLKLMQEGVTVVNGRVNMKTFLWQP
ncbi:MGMT family protein [Acinetobacter rudis]|uniref:MGMT family protein n=1 Tax=Acinetobacter rudis TaxID=632955 RepID=A0AAW8J4W7_9GAMM|nr:MGMT family protein [Acinetobacter rudis]MDQ8934669.1 MGMT family protein [Acinetobacter rudis]MDQ8951566.1 MGMT family protein [Acinetobacter rudis]MDQ9016761.1 MGMT family protein [Acinetobacter rudis]